MLILNQNSIFDSTFVQFHEFQELLLEIEAGLAFVCFIILALISVAAMEAHTEVNERLKEQELADELDKERRNRFFMEN